MSRQRKRPRSRATPRGEPAVKQAHPIWVDVSGRRMFVVGFTSVAPRTASSRTRWMSMRTAPIGPAAISLTDASTAPNAA